MPPAEFRGQQPHDRGERRHGDDGAGAKAGQIQGRFNARGKGQRRQHAEQMRAARQAVQRAHRK
jgi:hypothetical protein